MARMGLSVVIVARLCNTVGCGSGGPLYPIFATGEDHHMHTRDAIRACYNTTRRHGTLERTISSTSIRGIDGR